MGNRVIAFNKAVGNYRSVLTHVAILAFLWHVIKQNSNRLQQATRDHVRSLAVTGLKFWWLVVLVLFFRPSVVLRFSIGGQMYMWRINAVLKGRGPQFPCLRCDVNPRGHILSGFIGQYCKSLVGFVYKHSAHSISRCEISVGISSASFVKNDSLYIALRLTECRSQSRRVSRFSIRVFVSDVFRSCFLHLSNSNTNMLTSCFK